MSDDKFQPVPTHVRQIQDVTNIDRMDSQDRQKLNPRVKLILLCEEARATLGRDPRGGHVFLVARPRVLLQLLLDLQELKMLDLIQLQRPVVLGADGGDVVGWFDGAPIVARCQAVDDRLYAVAEEQMPESRMIDRRRAAELRMHAARGTLANLRDGGI